MNWIEPLIILLLILLNGFLAMSEMAVVSSRKVRLESRAESGDEGARVALDLTASPGRFLSTIQIGITLVGILAGAFGGATLADPLAVTLQNMGLPPSYAGPLSVGLVVLVITYLSLVIGELAPKQIALIQPERIAIKVAPFMRVLSRLALPFVQVLTFSSSVLLRLLGIRPTNEPSITEDEVKLLIDQGTQMGVFEPIEDTIVDKVFRLSDQRVSYLSTPRTEVLWLDLEDPQGLIIEKIRQSQYTYFPVARGDLDHLLGYVRASDLLSQCLGGNCTVDIEGAIQPPVLVPEHMPAFAVLERFRSSGSEIAFTMNEYGGVEGLVTLRDILEALVGEIPQAADLKNPSIVERDDGSFLIDGMLPIEEFRDIFDLNELPGEEENYFQTLGGFVLTSLGRIPNPGDNFEYEGLRLEVMDMDGNRIDKVLVAPLSPD